MAHTTKTERHIDNWTTSTRKIGDEISMSLMSDNLTAQLVQSRQSEGSLTVEKNYWADSETFIKLREEHQ
jgi:hypothetical protein